MNYEYITALIDDPLPESRLINNPAIEAPWTVNGTLCAAAKGLRVAKASFKLISILMFEQGLLQNNVVIMVVLSELWKCY